MTWILLNVKHISQGPVIVKIVRNYYIVVKILLIQLIRHNIFLNKIELNH